MAGADKARGHQPPEASGSPATERNVQEVSLAKHGRAFKSEKRKKEISRLKKQEEKRQRRFTGEAEKAPDADVETVETAGEAEKAPEAAVETLETAGEAEKAPDAAAETVKTAVAETAEPAPRPAE